MPDHLGPGEARGAYALGMNRAGRCAHLYRRRGAKRLRTGPYALLILLLFRLIGVQPLVQSFFKDTTLQRRVVFITVPCTFKRTLQLQQGNHALGQP